MKLLFDTSVWVEHLRHAVLENVIGKLRGRFVLGMDAVVASELRAGCRSKKERNVVRKLLAPFEAAGRLLCPSAGDFARASLSLSRLRERGRLPSGSKGALLDGLIATLAVREGALLVTHNVSDFAALGKALPLRFEHFDTFQQRL
jgi:predicted nucleic acid-binding protein